MLTNISFAARRLLFVSSGVLLPPGRRRIKKTPSRAELVGKTMTRNEKRRRIGARAHTTKAAASQAGPLHMAHAQPHTTSDDQPEHP